MTLPPNAADSYARIGDHPVYAITVRAGLHHVLSHRRYVANSSERQLDAQADGMARLSGRLG